MSSVETSLQSGDSFSVPGEAAALPIESIALTINRLCDAADQMRLAVTEVLSVTMFCAEVKRSLTSLIGQELHEPISTAEPVLDQLYQDAHHNLAAMRRAGRQTMSAINEIQEAALTLCRLGARLDAQQMQAAAALGNDRRALSASGPGLCAPTEF